MMMIEPPPTRRIAGTAYLIDRNTPSRVYCGLSPPVGQRHLDRLAQNADPGIGHHHVQTSKALLGGFDYCRPALLDTLVMVKKDRFAPGATNLLRYRPTCGIFQVGYDGLGAASRECRRARGADSRCAAGYDRDLGVHLAHSVLQSAERRKFIADRQSDYAERSARKKVAGRFRKSAEQPAGPETARTPRSRVGSLPSGCH
jgi:hypothetical protein